MRSLLMVNRKVISFQVFFIQKCKDRQPAKLLIDFWKGWMFKLRNTIYGVSIINNTEK